MTRSPERLTLASDENLAAIRDKWIAIGLSTEPADRPRAEAAVRLAYRQAGFSDSIRMIWTGSPLGGAAMVDSLTRRASGWRAATDVMSRALCVAKRRALTPAAREVSMQIVSAVACPVAMQVTGQVWAPVNRAVAQAFKRPMAVPGYAQHDAPQMALYDALRESGLDVPELGALNEIAQSCGWWWSFDDVCVLSERPSRLQRDGRGRLCSSNGPAVAYPDGWSVEASRAGRAWPS